MPNVKYTDEFPLFRERGDQTTNPAWGDVADTFGVVIGSPNADQVELRIQGTAPEGVYTLNLSGTVEINSSNNDVEARFSIDGGVTWDFFSRDVEANARIGWTFAFPIDVGLGSFDFIGQIKKQNPQNTLQIHGFNMWFHRIG